MSTKTQYFCDCCGRELNNCRWHPLELAIYGERYWRGDVCEECELKFFEALNAILTSNGLAPVLVPRHG